MSSGVQIAPEALQVLLVGRKEEDYFLIREILERNRGILPAELDHSRSIEEAHARLQQKAYGLILFEAETGDAEAVQLVSEFHHSGRSVPFILLTENADEETVADLIRSGNWNCITRSQLDGATLVRSIRGTLALHSMQRESRSAEERVRKLSRAVEQSPDLVMITDRHGTIEYVNPAFEKLTGYKKEDVYGKNPRILKSGEQGPDVYNEMWRTILAGNVFRGILINRKKNGELYYVEKSICPVRDADGQITHFIANGRDLTERLHLEAELLQAQKMDAVGRLAGGVAHDFNNLLTIITSYSELALDDLPADAAAASKIHEVLLAAKRAAELTRQLLAFSRKQPQALRIVDINPVIAGISKMLPRLIGEDIEFTFIPGQGLGPVRIDPVQMEQVLMNLAANARDAMPQGGHLRIETSHAHLDQDYIQQKPAAIPAGTYSIITVTDNGCGIPPEDISHIFEPFYTTKAEGRGTGLGLATVYGIVKQNKGFIWVYSEPGSGTVFKIYLPCVKKTFTSDRSRPECTKTIAGTETLLLVEDEKTVRKASAEFLRLQGYRVLEANDGVNALAIAKENLSAIDLLVTDVVMPNMSGGELAKKLRELGPRIRLLFVSGYAGKTVLDHDVLDLETNFLQKPYSLKELAAKIRTALDCA